MTIQIAYFGEILFINSFIFSQFNDFFHVQLKQTLALIESFQY